VRWRLNNLITSLGTRRTKRRFWCSGLMIPNSLIAAFSADVSSGASTIPMNAPGDPLMGRQTSHWMGLLGRPNA